MYNQDELIAGSWRARSRWLADQSTELYGEITDFEGSNLNPIERDLAMVDRAGSEPSESPSTYRLKIGKDLDHVRGRPGGARTRAP
jgi:hypothetical protein